MALPRAARGTQSGLATHSLNNPLPDTDQQKIRDLIESAHRNMNNLDEEILRVTNTLKTLRQQKQELKEQIRILRAEISPLKLFPDELITEIFERCGTGTVSLRHNRSRFPWNVSRVCSRWRRVVWSAPSLWKLIKIDGPSEKYRPHVIKSIMQTLLSHNNTLFSISIEDDQAKPRVAGMLLEFGQRISGLTIANLGGASFRMVCGLSKGIFSSLERLEIHFAGGDSFPSQEVHASSLLGATRLRDVVLFGTSDQSVSPHLSLPWRQLTNLGIHDIPLSPTCAHRFLFQCEALVSCHLFVTKEHNALAMLGPIILPNLRSLIVMINHPRSWDRFFEPLVVPALVDLTFGVSSARSWPSKLPSTPLMLLVNRSECEVRRLTVMKEDYALPTAVDLEPLLQTFPLLESIDFNESITFDRLTLHRMIENRMLPHLKSARFQVLPSAFEAFLDWMNWQAENKLLGFSKLLNVCLELGLFPLDAISRASERWKLVAETYKAAGICATMSDSWNDDMF